MAVARLSRRGTLAAAAGSVGAPAQFAVGSFTKPTATGLQAVSGVGFEPKALIVWSVGSPAAAGTWSAHVRGSVGFSDGVDDYAVGFLSDSNQATSNAARNVAAAIITNPNSIGTGVNSQAVVDSFDADGFTLDWAVNDGGNQFEYMFLAIGGDDVEAKAVNWMIPTSTGDFSVDSIGFEPSLVLHATSVVGGALPAAAGSAAALGFGAMADDGSQWTNTWEALDGLGTSATCRYQRTDRCFSWVSSDLMRAQASFVSMDADGFTVNFDATLGAYNAISLCLSGVQAKVGAVAKTTSAAPTTQSVAGVGFDPAAVLVTHDSEVANTAVVAHAFWGLGAAAGAGERAAAMTDRDASGTTDVDAIWLNDAALAIANNFGVIGPKGAVTPTSGGFDLEFSANDASATQILYLALA